jgi:hypothetical protein
VAIARATVGTIYSGTLIIVTSERDGTLQVPLNANAL